MSDNEPELPRRTRGSHLPAAAYRTVGITKVPDSRWADDEPVLRILLNGLKRWEPKGRPTGGPAA